MSNDEQKLPKNENLYSERKGGDCTVQGGVHADEPEPSLDGRARLHGKLLG
ncbi:hypothetical protein ACFQ0B_41405 [Nonomuraea thailandensis]